MQTDEETFNLEIVTPWAERLMIQIAPPKPDVSIHPGPYRLVNQRCSYHGCNRLYTIAERGRSTARRSARRNPNRIDANSSAPA